jgi:hypothetical protein
VNFNAATLALGSRLRQRGCKVTGQEEAREPREKNHKGVDQKEAQESHHILLGMQENVRECEGVNTHTPKATSTLGDGVPVNSQNFRERFQGPKLDGLWRSLYHWKALRTKMCEMGSYCSFGHLKHKLWAKERPGVKLAV